MFKMGQFSTMIPWEPNRSGKNTSFRSLSRWTAGTPGASARSYTKGG